MATLKEIYTNALQGTTLPNASELEILNNALSGSEEEIEKAFSDFFAVAKFNENEPNSFENHLLSEFIKEIKPGLSLPIQRITSGLMKNKAFPFQKKRALTLACVRIIISDAVEPADSIPRDELDLFLALNMQKTHLLKIASSTEIEAEFIFTQLLIYHESQGPSSGAFIHDYWNAVFDACARNSFHPNMPIIFLTFLQRISQTSHRYFAVLTFQHALINVIFSKVQYPSGLVKKICEWGGDNLNPRYQYPSDSDFLGGILSHLMLNCFRNDKTIEVLECLANAFLRIVRNNNFIDRVLAKTTIESIVKKYPSIKKDNVFRHFAHLMYNNGNHQINMSLELFFIGMRQCIDLSRRTENFHAQPQAPIVRLVDRIYQSPYISQTDREAISRIPDNSDEMKLLLEEFNLTWLSKGDLLAILNNPNDEKTKHTILAKLTAPESPESPLKNRVDSFVCSPIKHFLWNLLIDSMQPNCPEEEEKTDSFEVTENLISQLLSHERITSEQKTRLRNGCLRLLAFPSESNQDCKTLLDRLVPTSNNSDKQSDNLLYECAHYQGKKAVFLFKQMLAYVKDNLCRPREDITYFKLNDNITLYGNILRACLDNPNSKMLEAYFTFLQDIGKFVDSRFFSWAIFDSQFSSTHFIPDINSVLSNVLPQLINENDFKSLEKLCDIIKKTFKPDYASHRLFLRQRLPCIIIESILDNSYNTNALKYLNQILSHFAIQPEFTTDLSTININRNKLQLIADKYPGGSIFSAILEKASSTEGNSVPISLRSFLTGVRLSLTESRSMSTFGADFSPAKAMARVGINPQSSGANKSNSLSDKQFDSCAATLN